MACPTQRPNWIRQVMHYDLLIIMTGESYLNHFFLVNLDVDIPSLAE
jgi:hypothetical protein